MKNIYIFSALILTLASQAQTTATVASLPDKPTIDFYGMAPVSGATWGFGMGVASKPFYLDRANVLHPTLISFGGDMFYAQLAHRQFRHVPLLAPQSGEAKVDLSNYIVTFNAMARISRSVNKTITPYLDLFAGVRITGAQASIEPYSVQDGYESSTSQDLGSHARLNYGATGGFLFRLTDIVSLNTGLMYSMMQRPGEMVNVKTARFEQTNLVADVINAPRSLMLIKFGITIRISESEDRDCDCKCRHHSDDYSQPAPVYRSAPSGNRVNINVKPKY
jgi:opacity protein-like surface antigen